jgi:sugar phosphate isomerase/epimerase
MQTAVQLYSLRGLDWPRYDLLDRVAAAGVDGVEFAGFGDATARSLAARLDEAGLATAGLHVPHEEVRDDYADTVAAARLLNADAVVVPYLDASHFADETAVRETAERLERLAVALDGHGVGCWYHTHEHEFATVGETGRTGVDWLARETTTLGLELDLGWALAAGVDPVALLEEYADRVPAVHLKDVVRDPAAERGGRPVGLGDGDLSVEDCIAAARAADVDWLVAEHDDPGDPLAWLDRTGEVLASV